MSKAASLLNMQQAVIRYVLANIPVEKNRAHVGKIRGERVIIGHKSYPFVPTVDEYFKDGDFVYCILPEQENIAAIVGVR